MVTTPFTPPEVPENWVTPYTSNNFYMHNEIPVWSVEGQSYQFQVEQYQHQVEGSQNSFMFDQNYDYQRAQTATQNVASAANQKTWGQNNYSNDLSPDQIYSDQDIDVVNNHEGQFTNKKTESIILQERLMKASDVTQSINHSVACLKEAREYMENLVISNGRDGNEMIEPIQEKEHEEEEKTKQNHGKCNTKKIKIETKALVQELENIQGMDHDYLNAWVDRSKQSTDTSSCIRHILADNFYRLLITVNSFFCSIQSDITSNFINTSYCLKSKLRKFDEKGLKVYSTSTSRIKSNLIYYDDLNGNKIQVPEQIGTTFALRRVGWFLRRVVEGRVHQNHAAL